MSSQRIWDPFNDMLSLRDAMGQLLESSFVRPGAAYSGATQAGSSFPLNVHGTADELTVEALLPGVSEEDVNVDLDRGVLTITARRHGAETAKGEQWHLREFNPGQFARSLSLPFPVEIEQVNATFSNGVLALTLPKAEAAKPRRIQIGGGQRTEQLNAPSER
jgi:HSP20 family protein